MNDQITRPGASTALAPRQQFSLAPTNFDEAMRFAELLAKSDLAPKDYKGKPGNCMIAMQMGAELGLSPMQAIQNIAVINGRPSVWGDSMLALCQAHPDFEDCQESDDGATATCTVLRRGRAPIARSFSMDEARTAGLLNKDGPWKTYPKRMRQMRARGFALRDAFADVLRGLMSAEEASDIPIDATPRRRGESRASEQKPIDQSKVVEAPQAGSEPAEVDAAEVKIGKGKNQGVKLGSLSPTQLDWYADNYNAEPRVKHYAGVLRKQRQAEAAAASKKAIDDAGTNAAWGLGPDVPSFLPVVQWSGRDAWLEKPLADADHPTLLTYGSAVATLLETIEDEQKAAELSAHLRDVEAAIAAKQPASGAP